MAGSNSSNGTSNGSLTGSSTTPLIELKDVTVERNGVELISGVNWTLEPGRHWAVLGPNGCGKSTMLRVACGYLWPNSGEVKRLGQTLVDLGTLRKSIGWVVADVANQIPPDELTVATVLSGRYAQLGLRGVKNQLPPESEYEEARELIKEMGCESLADKPFGILSQGERQQILVARARMARPLMIILDEPCTAMDPGVRERFLKWLDSIASTSAETALVMVTHHVEEIMPSFEKTLIMKSGKVLDAGSTSEVVTAESLKNLYAVDVERFEIIKGRHWVLWK